MKIMKSIIARTLENVEFVISINQIDKSRVNVHVNRIKVKENDADNPFPSFYVEHTKFHVKLDPYDIFKVIDYGISYNYTWDKKSKEEVKLWLKTNFY